nr:hypothetical protein [Tanacetum cinerariifolium]
MEILRITFAIIAGINKLESVSIKCRTCGGGGESGGFNMHPYDPHFCCYAYGLLTFVVTFTFVVQHLCDLHKCYYSGIDPDVGAVQHIDSQQASLEQVIGSPYTRDNSNLTVASATTITPTTSTVAGTAETLNRRFPHSVSQREKMSRRLPLEYIHLGRCTQVC